MKNRLYPEKAEFSVFEPTKAKYEILWSKLDKILSSTDREAAFIRYSTGVGKCFGDHAYIFTFVLESDAL